MQLHEVYIRIHIMWYIHVSMCQYNFLMKSMEVSAEQLSVVLFSGFIYIFVGGTLFRTVYI